MTSMMSRPSWAQPLPDLSGRTVVVVGGSGGVGEGIVGTMLASGARVIATGRDRGRLDDLARRLAGADGADGVDGVDRLETFVLDAMDGGLDGRVRLLRERHGRLDAAIISVASWGAQGRRPALSLADADWDAAIGANLTSVFRLQRALVPALTPGGALIQINGLSAEIPLPGAAGRAVGAAGTKSLTRTLAAELAGRGPRVYQLILGYVRTRARQRAGSHDGIDPIHIGWHTAELVAGTSPLADLDLQYFVDRAGPRASAAPSADTGDSAA